MKGLHAFGAAQQFCPNHIGGNVSIKFHPCCLGGADQWKAGSSLPEDSWNFIWTDGRGEEKLDSWIALHAPVDWRNHAELHGQAGIYQNTAMLGISCSLPLRVELTHPPHNLPLHVALASDGNLAGWCTSALFARSNRLEANNCRDLRQNFFPCPLVIFGKVDFSPGITIGANDM